MTAAESTKTLTPLSSIISSLGLIFFEYYYSYVDIKTKLGFAFLLVYFELLNKSQI